MARTTYSPVLGSCWTGAVGAGAGAGCDAGAGCGAGAGRGPEGVSLEGALGVVVVVVSAGVLVAGVVGLGDDEELLSLPERAGWKLISQPARFIVTMTASDQSRLRTTARLGMTSVSSRCIP